MSDPRPEGWRTGWSDRYRIGCGGNEVPVIYGGAWFLYVWDSEDRKHLWYGYRADRFYETAPWDMVPISEQIII